MPTQVVTHKAEDEGQESRDRSACKDGTSAKPSLPPPPTPARHSGIASLSLPARTFGPYRKAGRTAPPRILTLAASTAFSQPRPGASGATKLFSFPASCSGSPAGARPRHTFHIPSWAGALSARSRGPARSTLHSLGYQFGRNFKLR